MPISFKDDKNLIEVLTPIPNIGYKSFRSLFYGCENLTKIPEELFINNVGATDFTECFYGCSNLTEIPAGLFANIIYVTNFMNCFYDCSSLTEIPEGLFANNIDATNFENCFEGCTNLTETDIVIKAKKNLTVLMDKMIIRYTDLKNEAGVHDNKGSEIFSKAIYDFLYKYGLDDKYRELGHKTEEAYKWIQEAIDGKLLPNEVVIAKENLTILMQKNILAWKNLENSTNRYDNKIDSNFKGVISEFLHKYELEEKYNGNLNEVYQWIKQAVSMNILPSKVKIAKENLTKLMERDILGFIDLKNKDGVFDNNDKMPAFHNAIYHFLAKYGLEDQYVEYGDFLFKYDLKGPDIEKSKDMVYKWIKDAVRGDIQPNIVVLVKDNFIVLMERQILPILPIWESTSPLNKRYNEAFKELIGYFVDIYGLEEEYNKYKAKYGSESIYYLYEWSVQAINGGIEPEN